MTTRLPPSPGDLLRHAADLIREWGFTKNSFSCDKGAMCEEGALRASAGRDEHVWDKESIRWWRRNTVSNSWITYHPALKALYDSGGGPSHNDADSTTKELAIAKLLEAAELADKREELDRVYN